jgi:hypothetical protein
VFLANFLDAEIRKLALNGRKIRDWFCGFAAALL